MGTLSYILLYYRHNIKIVKTNKTRCQRDQDSPSLCSSPLSWPTSLGPRRARNCPDLRLSRDFGLTSRPTSSRTQRTSSTSFPTPRCSPSSERRIFRRQPEILFERKRLISLTLPLWTLLTTQYK